MWVGLLTEEEVPDEGGSLYDEDEGYAQAEGPVLGLVPPYLHAEQGAYATAKDGEEEKSGFGSSPLVVLRLPLIPTEHKECDDAHHQDKDNEIFPHNFNYLETQISQIKQIYF